MGGRVAETPSVRYNTYTPIRKINVKRIAIALVLALVLVACGGDNHDHDHAVEASRSAAADVPTTDEEVFVHLVRSELSGAPGVTDRELVEAGLLTCETIETVGWEFFVREISKSNADEHFTTVMVAASLVAFCPELTPPDWDEEEARF